MRCAAHMRLLVSLAVVLLLHGCSSLPRYVISNNTDSIITINYSYPVYPNSSGDDRICPIKQMGAFPETTQERLSPGPVAWQKLSADKYIFNELECSIQVAIISGASVTIAAHDPFKKPIAPLVESDLIFLRIANEKQNVFLGGMEIFERFEQIENKLYVYNFP